MKMPKYKEQLVFTVTISNEGYPDHDFKIYTNGAIDGFPKGEKVSVSNKIPVFIHEAFVRGENQALSAAMIDRWEEKMFHKEKSSLPDKNPITE